MSDSSLAARSCSVLLKVWFKCWGCKLRRLTGKRPNCEWRFVADSAISNQTESRRGCHGMSTELDKEEEKEKKGVVIREKIRRRGVYLDWSVIWRSTDTTSCQQQSERSSAYLLQLSAGSPLLALLWIKTYRKQNRTRSFLIISSFS